MLLWFIGNLIYTTVNQSEPWACSCEAEHFFLAVPCLGLKGSAVISRSPELCEAVTRLHKEAGGGYVLAHRCVWTGAGMWSKMRSSCFSPSWVNASGRSSSNLGAGVSWLWGCQRSQMGDVWKESALLHFNAPQPGYWFKFIRFHCDLINFHRVQN